MSIHRLLGAACALLLTVMPFGTVHAITVKLEFTATFGDGRFGTPSTEAEPALTGWFKYEAASINSAIDYLTDVSLIIDDYIYDVPDFTYDSGSAFSLCIGDVADTDNGACGIGPTGRDFLISWNNNTLEPIQVAYSTAGINDYWAAGASVPGVINDFSVSEVPVPPALLLFSTGLLGLIGTAFQRRPNHT